MRLTVLQKKSFIKQEALALAKASGKIAAQLDGKTIIKEFYVKGKLVNIVAK